MKIEPACACIGKPAFTGVQKRKRTNQMAVESSTMIALRKINYNSTMAEILPVLQSISEIQHYECVEFFRNTQHTYENAPARNVVAAALTGLVLGGEFMTCDMYEGARPYCVDPFLNQLRNAMLRVPKVQAMTKENANSRLAVPPFASGWFAQRWLIRA
jgi:hypothetical protein